MSSRSSTYAPTHWPRGHLRHSLDALAFLRALELTHPEAASTRDWAFTSATVRRRLYGRRLFWGVARHGGDGPLSTLNVVYRRWRLSLPLPVPSR